MLKNLVPSKVYKDVYTKQIIGVSYRSTSDSNLNEVLFSREKAIELGLQDSDVLECMDLPCILVFTGKRRLIFPVGNEMYFDSNLADDGIIVTLGTQTICGHVFDKFSGIEMDCEDSIKRCECSYEEQIKSSEREYR